MVLEGQRGRVAAFYGREVCEVSAVVLLFFWFWFWFWIFVLLGGRRVRVVLQ